MVAAAPVAAQRAQSFEISAFGGGYFGSNIYQGPIPIRTGPITTVGVNSVRPLGRPRSASTCPRQFGVEFSWSGADPDAELLGRVQRVRAEGRRVDQQLRLRRDVQLRTAARLGLPRAGPRLDLLRADASRLRSGRRSPIVAKSTSPATPPRHEGVHESALGVARFDARYRWVEHGPHDRHRRRLLLLLLRATPAPTTAPSELTGGLTYVCVQVG